MASLKNWARSLPERHGRRTVLLLAAILLLGFGLRAYRVVEPLGTPGDDSRAYFGLAKSLYEDGSYGGGSFENPTDWSPGAPLLYAAAFYATGGAREGTARIIELLAGLGAIIVVYLLGRRLNCRPAGLLGAFGVAIYPPFIHSTGALFSEPLAILTLPAAVLAFLWAAERERVVAWLVPGALFGLTALFRPEYLLVGLAFAALAAARSIGKSGWRRGLVSGAALLTALVVTIAPWVIRNQIAIDQATLSTGGGKALYVGTFLPADGEYERVKALLVERYRGQTLEPGSPQLDRVDPTPLFDRVAQRYPDLPRDEALGKIGKQNLSEYLGEDPVGYGAMTVRKVWRMWSGGVGEAMSSVPGRIVQVLLLLLGIGGLGVLARRRRWWELAATATPIAVLTGIGALTLAAPRRNEILMTLVFPLAGALLATGASALFSKRSWSPRRASSPQS